MINEDDVFEELTEDVSDIYEEESREVLSEKGQTKATLASLALYLFRLVAVFVIIFLINRFVFTFANVASGSMEPTLMTHSYIGINRVSYMFSSPKRGTIISFFRPEDEKKLEYVKRVIGLPGDTVSILEGVVYINGVLLVEPYVNEVSDFVFDQEFVVPANCYFVMGDNRNHSMDSRKWQQPFVHKNSITGTVVFRLTNQFGIITIPAYESVEMSDK